MNCCLFELEGLLASFAEHIWKPLVTIIKEIKRITEEDYWEDYQEALLSQEIDYKTV